MRGIHNLHLRCPTSAVIKLVSLMVPAPATMTGREAEGRLQISATSMTRYGTKKQNSRGLGVTAESDSCILCLSFLTMPQVLLCQNSAETISCSDNTGCIQKLGFLFSARQHSQGQVVHQMESSDVSCLYSPYRV